SAAVGWIALIVVLLLWRRVAWPNVRDRRGVDAPLVLTLRGRSRRTRIEFGLRQHVEIHAVRALLRAIERREWNVAGRAGLRGNSRDLSGFEIASARGRRNDPFRDWLTRGDEHRNRRRRRHRGTTLAARTVITREHEWTPHDRGD